MRSEQLGFSQRFSYGCPGSYLGFLTLYAASLATAPAGAPEQPFWGTALAFLALISGLLTASLNIGPLRCARDGSSQARCRPELESKYLTTG